MRRRLMLSAAIALLVAGPACSAKPGAKPLDPATALQIRLLTLDSHLDTPASLALPGWSITDAHTVAEGLHAGRSAAHEEGRPRWRVLGDLYPARPAGRRFHPQVRAISR